MQVCERHDCSGDAIQAVHCRGHHIVSGSASGTVRLHSASSGIAQAIKLPRAMAVSALAIVYAGDAAGTASGAQVSDSAASMPDGCVLSASYSRIHTHALASGAAVSELEAHADAITALSLSQGNGMVYSASHDTTIKGWAIGASDWPWAASGLPLVELDTPDASVPLCCEVRRLCAGDEGLRVGSMERTLPECLRLPPVGMLHVAQWPQGCCRGSVQVLCSCGVRAQCFVTALQSVLSARAPAAIVAGAAL